MENNVSSTGADPHFWERVRQRAFELSQLRGKVEGHEWEDWFQAEKEIRETLATPATNGLPTEDDQTTKGPLHSPVRSAVPLSNEKRTDPGHKDSTRLAVSLFQALAVCLGILLILLAIILAGKGEQVDYKILQHLFAEVGAVIVAFGLLHLFYDRAFRREFTSKQRSNFAKSSKRIFSY